MSTTNKLYTFKEIMTDGILVKQGEKLVQKRIDEVLIPMIQRPYAQGRKSQESIRNKFLADIFAALCDEDTKQLELNFLYGTFVNQDDDRNVFELLDGQQRMTTLFLLYWYLANQERHKDGFVWPDYLNKFTYQTRTTSTDFLNKLVTTEVNTDIIPSKAIRKSAWFSKSFDKDTTIDAMLRMLNSIDSFYKKANKKPTLGDLEKLKFYVLELNGFGLTEELFIKMNARGLQLTPFENFKADLIGYMKKNKDYCSKVEATLSRIPRNVDYWLNFSSMMDGKWVDLFWDKPIGHEDSGSKQCDISFFRFIQRFFANKAILLTDKSNKAKAREDIFVQFFTSNIEVKQYLGFNVYSAFIEKAKVTEIDLLRQLEKVLNYLSHPTIGKIMLDALTAPWETERPWQPWGTVGTQKADVGQRQMIILSSLAEYIDKVPTIDDFDKDAYTKWMRFVHILAQGTDINGIDAQITLTRQLKEILDIEEDAYRKPHQAIVSYRDTHRDNRYLDAEAEKAGKILSDSTWNEVFAEAEKDPFLQGSCMFYYQPNIEIEAYKSRTQKVKLIFQENGITEPFAKNYLLMRGVLCRNYDWSSYRQRTTNFTITNRSADRYLRNLTIWNDNAEVKRFFRELLDCADVESMKHFIQQVVKEEYTVTYNEKQFNDENAKEYLNKVYHRLFKEEEMQPLHWLYAKELPAIGVYFFSNGRAALYKGHVNKFHLGNERHKYASAVIKEFEKKFDFQFADERQKENFDKFKGYTGEILTVSSKEGILPNNCILRVNFYSSDTIDLSINNQECANHLFEAFKQYHMVEDQTDKEIMGDGKLSSFFVNGQEHFNVNVIHNADRLGTEKILEIFELAYDTIQKYESVG